MTFIIVLLLLTNLGFWYAYDRMKYVYKEQLRMAFQANHQLYLQNAQLEADALVASHTAFARSYLAIKGNDENTFSKDFAKLLSAAAPNQEGK